MKVVCLHAMCLSIPLHEMSGGPLVVGTFAIMPVCATMNAELHGWKKRRVNEEGDIWIFAVASDILLRRERRSGLESSCSFL